MESIIVQYVESGNFWDDPRNDALITALMHALNRLTHALMPLKS